MGEREKDWRERKRERATEREKDIKMGQEWEREKDRKIGMVGERKI